MYQNPTYQIIQFVKFDDMESDSIKLSYGVPQGYVLGPLLSTMYT